MDDQLRPSLRDDNIGTAEAGDDILVIFQAKATPTSKTLQAAVIPHTSNRSDLETNMPN